MNLPDKIHLINGMDGTIWTVNEDAPGGVEYIKTAPIAKINGGAEVPCSGVLVAMQAEARLFINANVWDGEDRSGATNDRATFNPDELQELIDDMLEHMSN